MNCFYWDASALAKRYTTEVGTPIVNNLFTRFTHTRTMCLHICTGEIISILVRKKNAGILTDVVFAQAMSNFRVEVLDDANFSLVSITDSLIEGSYQLIERYSLNATDALILQSAVEVVTTVGRAGNNLVLITSDLRLLRAAQVEGLHTFNPETDNQAILDTFIDLS